MLPNFYPEVEGLRNDYFCTVAFVRTMINHFKNKNEKRSEGAEHDVKNFNEDIIGN